MFLLNRLNKGLPSSLFGFRNNSTRKDKAKIGVGSGFITSYNIVNKLIKVGELFLLYKNG